MKTFILGCAFLAGLGACTNEDPQLKSMRSQGGGIGATKFDSVNSAPQSLHVSKEDLDYMRKLAPAGSERLTPQELIAYTINVMKKDPSARVALAPLFLANFQKLDQAKGAGLTGQPGATGAAVPQRK